MTIEKLLNSRLFVLILVASASLVACGPDSSNPKIDDPADAVGETNALTIAPGSSFIVGGSVDKDYYYPWVVELNGCRGVLIAPRWVLTAAHCLTGRPSGDWVDYSRTDIHSGRHVTQTRLSLNSGADPRAGVTIHPDFDPFTARTNDIALIELASPFSPELYIQTVALPSTPRQPGVIGAYVSFSHDQPLPEGDVAVFRAPIPDDIGVKTFSIWAPDANATGAPRDSGSGFVTIEGGRAVVRGVAVSGTPLPDGAPPSGLTNFTDVFQYRSWIISVMGEDASTLEGNTRVRRSGANARGVVGIGCGDPNGTYWAPLDVVGVELRPMCQPDSRQAIVCAIQGTLQGGSFSFPNERSVRHLAIATRSVGGSVTNEIIPPTSTKVVTHNGNPPAGATRLYECEIKSLLSQSAPPVGDVVVDP